MVAVRNGPRSFLCPRCDRMMTPRMNGKDGSYFLGCPRFPYCRGTRELPSNPGPGWYCLVVLFVGFAAGAASAFACAHAGCFNLK